MKLSKCLSAEEDWEESKGRLSRTFLQLCTPTLKNKPMGEAKFSHLEGNCHVNDPLELESIKTVVHSKDAKQESFWVIMVAHSMSNPSGMKQHPQESPNQCHDGFMSPNLFWHTGPIQIQRQNH